MRLWTSLPGAMDEGAVLLRRLVAFAVFLTALSSAAGFLTSRFLEGWRRLLSGNVTVQIYVEENVEEARAAILETTLQSPGVVEARILDDAEMAALLTPWFGGDTALLAELPAPLVMDLKVAREAGFDSLNFEASLQALGWRATANDHLLWFERNAVTLARAGSLFTLLTTLILLAALVAMTHAARSSFALNRESIEILSLVGAKDSDVAAQFAAQAFKAAAAGGVSGSVLAAATLMMLDLFYRGEAFRLLTLSAGERWQLWLLLMALPAAAAALAALTAWLTVMRRLAAQGTRDSF